jgi:hypothetical protein
MISFIKRLFGLSVSEDVSDTDKLRFVEKHLLVLRLKGYEIQHFTVPGVKTIFYKMRNNRTYVSRLYDTNNDRTLYNAGCLQYFYWEKTTKGIFGRSTKSYLDADYQAIKNYLNEQYVEFHKIRWIKKYFTKNN